MSTAKALMNSVRRSMLLGDRGACMAAVINARLVEMGKGALLWGGGCFVTTLFRRYLEQGQGCHKPFLPAILPRRYPAGQMWKKYGSSEDGLKSTDIMTFTVMIMRMDRKKSFLAQRRSSTMERPIQA